MRGRQPRKCGGMAMKELPAADLIAAAIAHRAECPACRWGGPSASPCSTGRALTRAAIAAEAAADAAAHATSCAACARGDLCVEALVIAGIRAALE